MRNEREWELSKRLSAFLESTVYPVRFRGWDVEPITDKARQATHGDLVFRKSSAVAYVDEKAYATVWDGCLIELMQDLKAWEPGWFHTLTHCTHLICGYYKTASAKEPASVYKVEWPKFREAYMRLCRDEPSEDKPSAPRQPEGLRPDPVRKSEVVADQRLHRAALGQAGFYRRGRRRLETRVGLDGAQGKGGNGMTGFLLFMGGLWLAGLLLAWALTAVGGGEPKGPREAGR